jgi:hypothetical protein
VDDKVFTLAPGAIRSTTVHSLRRAPHLAMREGRQMIDSFASFNDDATALSTVASVGPALRHIPLAPKAHTAITAATGLKFDLATINKHIFSLKKGQPLPSRPFDVVSDSGILTGERHDVDPSSFAVESYIPFDESKQGVILALSNIRTRVKPIADLPDDDVSSQNVLAAELLYTASLCIRVTTVAAGPLSLLMCHGW